MTHIIRSSRFHGLVIRGSITQDEFDFVHLRVVMQAVIGVITIQKNTSYGEIGWEPLVDQVKLIKLAFPINPAEEQAIITFILAAYNSTLDVGYYIEQVEDFLGEKRVYAQITKAHIKDWRTLGDAIQNEAIRSKMGESKRHSPLIDIRATEKKDLIPTGIHSLDSRMGGGGLAQGEYGIICAYTGVGKTTLGLNFAWGAAKTRRKTLFITLELTEERIRERLYSLIGEFDYGMILHGDPPRRTREDIWTEVMERVQRFGGQYGEYLQTYDYSTEPCSVSTLEECVRAEIDRDPANPPQMMMIDWLMCLDEDAKNMKNQKFSGVEVRHKMQRYGDEIVRRLCNKYNLAVYVTHQADVKAEDMEVVTIKHSSEAKSAAWKAALFLGVGASPESRRQGIFTVTGSKVRYGNLFQAKIRARLDQQRFESYDEGGEGDPVAEAVREQELSGQSPTANRLTITGVQ